MGQKAQNEKLDNCNVSIILQVMQVIKSSFDINVILCSKLMYFHRGDIPKLGEI